MQMYYVSRVAAAISLVVLTGAAWFSIRLAAADIQFRAGSSESVARAIAIQPDNAEYLAFHALQLEYDGADSTALLERAAAVSRMSSTPRIRLGLAAEIRGDFATAERWLLDAVGIDRQFEPRWTLANFYFRRENANAFWNWMRQALEVSYADRSPAFDLCWRVGDAATILERAIPERREVSAAYVMYVLESHRDAVAPAAMKLAGFSNPDDRAQLLAADDALIDAQDVKPARELWKAIGNSLPAGVTNGDFAATPLQHGFDWRWAEVPGVVRTKLEQGLRIALDGREPESCQLLSQIVSLEAHTRYRLRWETRTSGLSNPVGMEWRIGDQAGQIEASDAASTGEIRFNAPTELVPLTLTYHRPAGRARAEGSVEITRVSVERVQ